MPEALFPPLSLKELKTYSLQDRPSKVSREDFARPWRAGDTLRNFLDSLPSILAAQDLRAVAGAIREARENRRTIHWAMGAHLIKVGLNPLLIDLMKKGLVTALSLNGAGVVHDSELAMVGRTSEDVDRELGGGTFGMARETAEFLNQAINQGTSRGLGLGRAVGEALLEGGFPHTEASLLATAAREGIPATVHVAIGTDIIHLHPSMDPEATGRATYRDFQTFCSVVKTLERGVFLNIGSAVILPEIFLKAVTLVRNLGWPLKQITTVNFDFIRHYRPATNVVRRPTLEGGRGYYLIGHHELMIPLLAAAVLEGWGEKQP
jgi:deoxyhypusine synthase